MEEIRKELNDLIDQILTKQDVKRLLELIRRLYERS